MLGEPARCKQCVENNVAIQTLETNKKLEKKELQKKERLYFSDGESVSGESSSSGSSEENEHKDDDDQNGVSLNALKEQILGRKIITPQDLVGEKVVEELKLPVIENAEDLRKELSCAICQEPFFQPLSLSCGHSFCSNCLLWWLNHHSKLSTSEYGTCPTCRKDLVCSGESLGINTALRAAVSALYGEEVETRNQAEKLAKLKATAGENGGAHNRGYQVLREMNQQEWKKLVVKDSNGLFFYVRRSIVLDAADARMQLALAVDCQPGAPPPTLVDNGKVLQVSLCVLSMEEDEAEDSGFPMTLQDEDDDALITSEERFHSTVKVTVRDEGLESPLVVEEQLNETGTVTFGIPLQADEFQGDTISSRCIHFVHQETGAEYEIKITSNEESLEPAMASNGRPQENAFVEGSARGRGFVMDEDKYHRDDEKDEYENDGFLVMEGEEVEESDASESSEDENEEDVCCVCRQHGELIVCDGGDHFEGCGNSFHIQCVDRDQVPPGDWICGNCASVIDLDVGLKGHEFTADDKSKGDGKKRVLEESSGDESDSPAIVAPPGKKKRARILDSDSDED